jgi:hypothetical protein
LGPTPGGVGPTDVRVRTSALGARPLERERLLAGDPGGSTDGRSGHGEQQRRVRCDIRHFLLGPHVDVAFQQAAVRLL